MVEWNPWSEGIEASMEMDMEDERIKEGGCPKLFWTEK